MIDIHILYDKNTHKAKLKATTESLRDTNKKVNVSLIHNTNNLQNDRMRAFSRSKNKLVSFLHVGDIVGSDCFDKYHDELLESDSNFLCGICEYRSYDNKQAFKLQSTYTEFFEYQILLNSRYIAKPIVMKKDKALIYYNLNLPNFTDIDVMMYTLIYGEKWIRSGHDGLISILDKNEQAFKYDEYILKKYASPILYRWLLKSECIDIDESNSFANIIPVFLKEIIDMTEYDLQFEIPKSIEGENNV